MENICLDTDIIIDFLRNKPYAVEYIEAHRQDNLCTTIINLFELYHGAKISLKSKENLQLISNFQKSLTILNFSLLSIDIISEFSAFLKKKGTMVDHCDLFIGALAFEYGCVLRTNNVKDFSKIQGLKIC